MELESTLKLMYQLQASTAMLTKIAKVEKILNAQEAFLSV